MSEWSIAVMTAAWLGFLCSISPCPLTSNIAAVSFVARRVGNVRQVFGVGLLYMLGRTLTYIFLGTGLVAGILAAPQLSHLLQKYMTLLMGPMMILVAMVLLGLLKFKISSHDGAGDVLLKKVDKMGGGGAFMLGIFFALSFCPTSAALFFGSLLPLAVKHESWLLLPGIFGVATGLPVLLFAFLLAFGAHKVGKMYDRLAGFEVWAQRMTGIIFLLAGMGMTMTVTLGLKWW